MSLKTTIKEKNVGRTQRVYKTQDGALAGTKGFEWWLEKDAGTRSRQLFATVAYLKQGQQFRQRQAAQFARLYGGQSLYSFVGSNLSKMDQISSLAPNRPTYNLISSVVDTLVSRLTQQRPTPVFLTDNGDYKERNLAKKLNSFVQGEFYRTKAYEVGEYILTDALVQGTGCVKVLETQDKKVGIERVLLTELFVDLQEAAFGDPRRLYQVKLMDRTVLESTFPKHKLKAENAQKATIDSSTTTSQSVADLVMVVEGWALPSGEGADDGWHSICCSEGELFGEKWTKKTFPFVFLHHKKRQLGFWAQGTAESLLGTQLELNSLLDTISKSIKLIGVPRVFIEEGSKVNKAAFQNKIGMIIPYRGTPPVFAVSQSNAPELYEERARLIQFGFEQEGLSMLAATSQKPAGLNSGEAQRVYQDINSDRFAALERRYTNFYVDLAYQIIDKAIDIADREGTYKTVFVDRRSGSKEIELPDIKLLKDPFVIQAFVQSSLPKEPAGRLQKITEMIQSNMITIQEGRRLLDFPDLGQIETLANAAEERIFAQLDEIIENGVYEGPDQWMNLEKATEIVTQYINLYSTCKLEEEKMQMLRDYFAEIQDLKMAMMPPQMPMGMPPGGGIENQLAVPMPLPQSPMLPQGGGGGGGMPMFAEGGLVEDQKKNPNLTESDLPEWLQKVRETTVPAFQAASKAVQSIPGIDLATQAFELTSPAAYAFRQAGTPEPQGGLLEQISHVPGAQVAADIPVGWKVLKGQGKNLMDDIKSLQEKLINKQSEMLNNPMSPNTRDRKLFEIKEIEKDIDALKSKLKSSPQLEVTRTPEEVAKMSEQNKKNKFIEDLNLFLTVDSDIKNIIENNSTLEASKKIKSDLIAHYKSTQRELKKEWAEMHHEKTQDADWQKHKNFLEDSYNKAKQFIKDLEKTTETELVEIVEPYRQAHLEEKQFKAKEIAKQAAEEERLKNVVVPIEIEGGPLPKGQKKPQTNSVKVHHNWNDEIDKLIEQKNQLQKNYESGNIDKLSPKEFSKKRKELDSKVEELIKRRNQFIFGAPVKKD